MFSLWALLLLWGLCCGAGATPLQVPAQFPTAAQTYSSTESGGGSVVLAPNAALRTGAVVLGPTLTGVAQPEACSVACRAQPTCSWFEYCQQQGGCSQNVAPLAQGGCRLYSSNCKEEERLEPSLGIVAGFPVRLPPVTVAGFSQVNGQGIAGADYVCGASLVPGKCVLHSTEEALIYCLATADCKAVTVFLNGTDGCSNQTLNFLKTGVLSPDKSFVASGVVTLQPPEQRPVLDTQLTESEGQVILPTAAEAAAAPANADMMTDTSWRGCLLGNQTIMAGEVLAVLDNIPSPEDCCRECRKRYAAPGGCTVWNYCPSLGGCSYQGPQMASTEMLSAGQCQLRYQELVAPNIGWAPSLLAHGDGVPFVAGAPLTVSGPSAAVPGWQPLPGRGVEETNGGAVCTVQGLTNSGQCVEQMNSVDAMATWCMSQPLCAAFTPQQGSDPAPSEGLFQKNASADDRLLIPSSIMFLKDVGGSGGDGSSSGHGDGGASDGGSSGSGSSSSGGSGLSAGIVAAIAVASAVAAVTAAVAMYLTVRARRRRQLAAKVSRKLEEGGYGGDDGTGGSTMFGGTAAAGKGGDPPAGSTPASHGKGSKGGMPRPGVAAAKKLEELPTQVRQMEQLPTIHSLSFSLPLDAPLQPAVEVPGRRASSDSLLSPFAAASAGFVPGSATPSRAASMLPQDGAATGGDQGDGLGLPHSSVNLGAAVGGGKATTRTQQSAAAGNHRHLRPPLPRGGTLSSSLSGGAVASLALPAGVAPTSPRQQTGLPNASSLGPQTPMFSDHQESLVLQPYRSGSGSTTRSAFSAAMPAAAAGAAAAAATAADGNANDSGSTTHPYLGPAQVSEGPLPELALHVAQQEADTAEGGQQASGLDSSEETSSHLLLCEASLPPRLQEWVVHPSQITYQRWPNGRLRDLGSGASGHVYKATFNGETVAAKEMDLGRSTMVQEAFLNEALRLQALRHPNIVSLYGVCLAGTKGIVLLEYCEGRDLQSALAITAAGASQRLFGWHRRGRRVALDIAKAINYLHSKGIVHMDIKSSNVLLTSGGTAKLADVAFSQELAGNVLSDVPLVGTFPWIAPEVLLGAHQVNQAVDIYSFGVVLWEIVTGELPKRGGMRLPVVPYECPQDVSDLMMDCLSEDPAQRPTAQQLLQRLSRMLECSAAARTRASLLTSGSASAPVIGSSSRSPSPGPAGQPAHSQPPAFAAAAESPTTAGAAGGDATPRSGRAQSVASHPLSPSTTPASPGSGAPAGLEGQPSLRPRNLSAAPGPGSASPLSTAFSPSPSSQQQP